MSIIKKILVVLGILLLIIVVLGLSLPSKYEVSRSIIIDSPSDKVHEYTNNLLKWPKWSPWIDDDPNLKITIGEKNSGVGASQSWIGKDGEGSLIFTYSDPDSGIDYDLDFNKGQYKCVSSFKYEPLGESTKVIWTMKGDMTVPVIGGFFAYKMDDWVGKDFEEGLNNLKTVVESKN